MVAESHRTVNEDELRGMLAAGGAASGPLDLDDVIRRSRRRRSVSALGVASLSVLAVAGIGVAAVGGIGLPPGGMVMVASESSLDEGSIFRDGEADAGSDEIALAPAERLNHCGTAVAKVAPSATGLVLTPHFDERGAADGAERTGTVTLANTGGETVRGTLAAAPSLTLSLDGITVWHSGDTMLMLAVVVELEPGETVAYDAAITPVLCSEEDELSETFRDDLPALGSGVYELSAAIHLVPDDGSGPQLVAGPAQTIILE